MQRILYTLLSTFMILSLASAEAEYLTPMDFGYVLTEHGRKHHFPSRNWRRMMAQRWWTIGIVGENLSIVI